MSKFNLKFVAEIFDRLLSGEKADADERDLSQIFEFLATRLFSDVPSRNGQYFDGVVGLESKKVEQQKIEFRGEMWVGADKRQWTEPFQATITDMRITKQGFQNVMKIGKDRATGEVLSLFDAS
jgi:hypothetical protein